MELAAKTLVKLALLPGSKGAESFEFDIKRAFEWLSEERNEGKRHAAVLVLRELAVAMPTYFYQQVSGFFEHIFNAIRDSKPIIRDGAGQALRAALVVTSQRESAKQLNKPQWYQQCYDQAIVCFGDVPIKEKGVIKDERVHGALIVLNELLRCSNIVWERRYSALRCLQPEPTKHISEDFSTSYFPLIKAPFIDKWQHSSPPVYTSNPYDLELNNSAANLQESSVCRSILVEGYTEICARVMEQRLSKSPHVQQSVFLILPRLAALNRQEFVRNHLKSTINYLLTTLKGKEKDRNMAFVTLGFIAVAVDTDINVHLPSILEVIKAALPAKDASLKRKVVQDTSVFMCLTLLGHAVKSGISQSITDILDSMIATGLSPALTICFRELAENVPHVKGHISEGLLKMLSQVLMNKSLSQLGEIYERIIVSFGIVLIYAFRFRYAKA